jgi:hypothetical protein
MLLFVMLLVVISVAIAGCTSANPVSTSTEKSQKSINGSLSASATSNSFSPDCQEYKGDMERFKKFIPNMTDYNLRAYPYGNQLRAVYSKGYPSTETVTITIDDYSSCNFDTDYLLKNANRELGNSFVYSGTMYHGYPSIRAKVAIEGVLIELSQKIIVHPKLTVLIAVKRDNMSESDADAEIEKFANAIDFNNIAVTGGSSIDSPPQTAKTRIVKVTAQYNQQDGMITITNNGGSGIDELSYITISVNNANLPVKLDSKSGSVVTTKGTSATKNHVTATATFKDGGQQLVLDIYV